MAIYYKPQSPIQSGEDFIYPITTADQIMKSDKSRRLEQAGLIVADNSTSLGGVAAKDYARKTDTAPDSNKLGGKSASEYALKTDTAPDSSKLGGKAPEYYIQPRNLLDNSDFRNPVNQRGFVSGNAVEIYNHFIDRWISGGSSINPTLNNNGIMPNGAFLQRLDNLSIYIGRNMTFAIGLSSGDIVIASGTLTDVSDNDITIFNTTDGQNEISVGSDGGMWYVWIDYPSSTIQWAALYEGTYTADTLPPYVPKGYGAELAECQRYFYKVFNQSSFYGFTGETGNIYLYFDMPQIMRINNPTVVYDHVFSVVSNGYYEISGISSVTVYGKQLEIKCSSSKIGSNKSLNGYLNGGMLVIADL